jgi:hypothetical protein
MMLAATGLTSNEQGGVCIMYLSFVIDSTTVSAPTTAFSNAVYVHTSDFAKIVDISRADPEAVKERGVLCAVGEAVFFVRPSETYKPGSVGAGMMQRLAGQLTLSTPTPVTPFIPPRGNFPMASVQLEVDVLGSAPAEVGP